MPKITPTQRPRISQNLMRWGLSLDCFKCLNVILYQQIELFERQTRNVDLTVIDNGLFYPEYSRLKIEAAVCVKQAKLMEASNIDNALVEYEKASNIYSETVNLIDKAKENVRWAKVRFTTKRILTILLWILSVLISAVVSALFTCEVFSNFFNH